MTDIYFKIVDSDPGEHQIVVRFFSDKLPESALVASYKADGKTPSAYRTDYAITLPYPAPTGDALREFIMYHCPVDWFELQHKVKDPSIDTSLPGIAIGAVIKGTVPPREPTEAERLAQYEAAVDAHIDGTARAAGYNSIVTAISYADDPTNATWQAEGRAFRSWRAACWQKCHAVLDACRAGERAAPTVAELLAELPALDLAPAPLPAA